jgi:hypothetical protein
MAGLIYSTPKHEHTGHVSNQRKTLIYALNSGWLFDPVPDRLTSSLIQGSVSHRSYSSRPGGMPEQKIQCDIHWFEFTLWMLFLLGAVIKLVINDMFQMTCVVSQAWWILSNFVVQKTRDDVSFSKLTITMFFLSLHPFCLTESIEYV